jgi:DNA polymerase I-like protein with 3'-5' exonuclease and polymerase domains
MTASADSNGTFPHEARPAAEIYLRLGLAPIPVPHRSKNPDYGGWQLTRATAADLDRLFPRGRASNLGILNGEPSGNHHDADLDCPEAIAAAPLLLPPTGWVFGRESAPGSHRIYVTDRPLGKAQEEYRDLDRKMLVELRGTGGHTVYPPSTHEETGEPITWQEFAETAEVALEDLQRAVAKVAAAALIARHWPAKGSRDSASLALSGALTRAGWAAGDVARFIKAVATAAGDDEVRMRASKPDGTARRLGDGRTAWGWPKLAELLGAEGARVVQLARLWLGLPGTPVGAEQPTSRFLPIPPYRPFPLKALPSPLREYVEHGSRALRCDPAYLALPGLAVCAGLIGDSRAIRLRPTWTEPCVVWATPVSGSGTMKSPGFKLVVNPLWVVQRGLRRAYQQRLKDYQRALKQAGGDDEGLEKPVRQQLVVSDTTIEALTALLEDNGRGVLLAREELSGWLGSFARYKAQRGSSDLPNWLELHGAGTISYERKTGDRPSVFLPRALASVTGTIQPEVLAGALANRDLVNSGLLARMLLAMPDKQKKVWSEDAIDPDVEQAYLRLIDALQRLEGDTGRDGQAEPHVLRLSPEGREAFIAFYREWAEAQAQVEGEMASALAKLEAYAGRLALLHHVATHVALDTDDRRPVGPVGVEAGATLCRWFAYEARRIYAVLAESEEQRTVRRLVEFIRARGGSITTQALQNSNSRKYPTADLAGAALEALAQAGLGLWRDLPAGPKGGRPTRAFFLHKASDETDETPDGGGRDDDAPPQGPSDETPDETPPAPANPCVSEGFVGFVGRRTEDSGGNAPAGPGGEAPEGFVGRDGVPSGGFVGRDEDAPAYLLVTSPEGLEAVAAALDDTGLVGLDTETTGLDPHRDRVRLLSLNLDTTDGGRFSYLVDCSALDPAPLWDRLAEKELVAHNALFDLAFLARLGFIPAGPVHDPMLLSRLLHAGINVRHRLADCAQREMGQSLDKAQQRSDWSGTLTAEQLAYAARDADVLVPLYRSLTAKIHAAGLDRVATIERCALPAFLLLACSGVAFDRQAWDALATEADRAVKDLAGRLDEAAPPRPDRLPGQAGWSWDSPAQVKQAFAAAGLALESTDDEALAGLDHPMAELLRAYRAARRRVTGYGPDWGDYPSGGRIYADWNQLGSVAGRTSCSVPNLQQVPRDPRYRRCFVAPPGRVLVKADYSQLQLRIAAKIAGDEAMLAAYARGEDLHTLTARQLTGKADVSKADRQLAKAVNFGLLFGLGAKGLRGYAKGNYGLDLTEEEAARYRGAFFSAYPGLGRWHRKAGNSTASECRTLAGRRRLLDAETPYTHRLNTPVQGTEADGAKLAMALLWERRHEVPGAFPVLFGHDEIVVECDEGQADQVRDWLRRAMLDGMAPLIEPVPVEVEVTVARTWGGDP